MIIGEVAAHQVVRVLTKYLDDFWELTQGVEVLGEGIADRS